MECTQCDETCKTCTGGSANSCTSCDSGKFLNATSCVDKCPSNTYADIKELKCKKCAAECATCDGLNGCNSCWTDAFLEGAKCVKACKTGSYGNTKTRTCDKCDSTCQTCNGNGPNSCLTCVSPFYLEKSKACVENCADYHFAVATPVRKCDECHAPCITCTGAKENQCTSCKTGYQLMETTCVSCRSASFKHDESKNAKGDGVCTSDC